MGSAEGADPGFLGFSDLINTLKLCYLPDQSHEIDQVLQSEQFHDHIAKTENNLEKCVSLVSDAQKLSAQNMNIPHEVTINVVLVCGEYHKPDLWASLQCVLYAEDLMKHFLEISHCSNVFQLLLKNKVDTFLQKLRPKLERASWRKYPAAISSFVWIISNLECPYVGDHFNSILPTCLLLVDDHETRNKIIGLKCLQHLASNVSRAELTQYGRGPVIYHAVEHLAYSLEPALLQALVACLIPLLDKTEHNGIKYTLQWDRFDDVILVWLLSMERQQNLELRQVYVQGLQSMVSAMGLSCARWTNELLDVLSEYCDHQSTRDLALECLNSFTESVWPRLNNSFTQVILIALKVLVCAVYQDPVQHSTILYVKKVFRSLDKLCNSRYQEFVRDLENSSDFQEILPFLRCHSWT